MKKALYLYLCLSFTGLGFLACSSSDNGEEPPTAPTLDELIDQGWQAFETGDYQTAVAKFTAARDQAPNDAEIFNGLGWSLFKQDNISQAHNEFLGGTKKGNVPADIYAGFAFVLNILKDYAESSKQAELALAEEPTWSFLHLSGLNVDDLRVLLAANYFLVGDFSRSLSQVKLLNPSFSADISNTTGQSALAAEIEQLKSATQ